MSSIGCTCSFCIVRRFSRSRSGRDQRSEKLRSRIPASEGNKLRALVLLIILQCDHDAGCTLELSVLDLQCVRSARRPRRAAEREMLPGKTPSLREKACLVRTHPHKAMATGLGRTCDALLDRASDDGHVIGVVAVLHELVLGRELARQGIVKAARHLVPDRRALSSPFVSHCARTKCYF